MGKWKGHRGNVGEGLGNPIKGLLDIARVGPDGAYRVHVCIGPFFLCLIIWASSLSLIKTNHTNVSQEYYFSKQHCI